MRVKFPLVNFKEGENPWVTYTKQKIFRQNNCMNLVITGMPGSGKSWGMLSYFCLLDPDFELDNNFFFRAIDLMKAIKAGWFKAGKIWGYDEAGIDANNLNYFNIINKGLNALFQTARHRNYVFGLTLPFLNMLSKGVRVLMTAQFQAQGWNRDNKTVIIPRTLEYNGEVDKFYRKRLIIRKDGDIVKCNRMLLPKPPKKIAREYEKIKKEYTQELYNSVYKDMEAFENKESGAKDKFLLSDREEICLDYLKSGKLVPDIKELMSCSRQNVYQIMKNLVKKGVVIKGKKALDNSIREYQIIDKRDSVNIGSY